MEDFTIEQKLRMESDENLIKMSRELTLSVLDNKSILRKFLMDHCGDFSLIKMIGLGASIAVELGYRYNALLTTQKQPSLSHKSLSKKYSVYIPSSYTVEVHSKVGDILEDDRPHNKVRAIQYLTGIYNNSEFEVKDIKELVTAIIKVDYKGVLRKNQ
jgi:hypothetical protein